MMLVNAKKAISGGSKISTYFFTRNVPTTAGSPLSSAREKMRENLAKSNALLQSNTQAIGLLPCLK